MKKRVLVIHGPNLNLLGEREPEVYGQITLYKLDRMIRSRGKQLGFEVVTFQANSEGELVEAIHRTKGNFDYIIINPGAYTHTSVALRDALLGVDVPFIEVHLSNVFSREGFRKASMLSDIALGVITGFGVYSYLMALYYIAGES
ncbi:3-dehydroquinate dehydratase II [Thermosulfidibacter takaii ABI70S6]|uniref:3-dehydroquinate dehydratase n=1 Tax=Thermosulfidibacter takaii (strain DSM 17441 / JCM 13301 / NBRC 103674 / ABI70S6) TaxID=1298851 RepID=A0A0S3QRN6_THET7|nr:type II 3-dehydroquinate dehydratase [Thermosulfidibacter takaii]BAT70957.1 3-dehydroquinate dehydratase II [Thermosulfidibacter takaii ABI70S6]